MASSSKYLSLIPQKPRGPTAYAVYTKQNYETVSKANGSMLDTEIKRIIHEAWGALSKEEREPFTERANKEREILVRSWERKESDRDIERKRWCDKLNLPPYTSWETIDSANKRLFIQVNDM